ncbi:NUDIX domain-containing protein [Deinococcus sp. HMF7604]|uniref:NUDIX domain-containing protein n=1 Tax=Deinococcus betulae TaxID=2873312 RepID=UPI001CCC7AD5|nr:NUDIX domain-containing protein [Deinococcus betulae]
MTPRLPPPDAGHYCRPPGVPERPSVGAVVLRPDAAGWQVAVVVELGPYQQLPKGGLEAGETPEAALHRELREEAGLQAVRLVKHLGTLERLNYVKTKWQVTRYFLGVTLEAEPAAPLEPGFLLEWHPLIACPPLFWPEQAALVAQVATDLQRGGIQGL